MTDQINKSRAVSRRSILETKVSVCVADSASITQCLGQSGACTIDATFQACQRYATIDDKVLALLEEWPRLESLMTAQFPHFLRLSEEERSLLPGAARFREIQRTLDVLTVERENLLTIVLKSRCKTPASVIAKLKVVERLIEDDDHPEARKLVSDTIDDLDPLLSFQRAPVTNLLNRRELFPLSCASGMAGKLQLRSQADLGRILSELIAAHDRAERRYRQMRSRAYPSSFNTRIAGQDLTEDERDKLVLAHEQEIGLAAASDAFDAAYDRIIAFTEAILNLRSSTQDFLRVKARACLWEASTDRLMDEGFPRVARLLSHLAAL